MNMEHLINDLKEKLIVRRENEFTKVKKMDKVTDRDSILISTGIIIELDFIIKAINELQVYHQKTKKL